MLGRRLRREEEKMKTEHLRKQFDLVAKEYDIQRRIYIPCYEDYYLTMVAFISKYIKQPNSILDLGAGTGLLTKYIYDHFPDAKYTLIDVSEQMLSVAKERFKGLTNFNFIIADYSSEIFKNTYDLVISGLSIHHLSNNNKQSLFNKVFHLLPQDGWFVNFDQFNAESVVINNMYNEWWYNLIRNSDLSKEEYDKWLERRELDQENTIEESKSMIRKSGFNLVECIYNYMKFGVIIAGKNT